MVCRPLSVRVSLFILLLCGLSLAKAEYTGVAFEIGDYDSDWKFSDGTRVVKTNSLRLQIEERAESGLTVGVSIAYLSMRVVGDATTPSTKFEGENLQLYLRQVVPLGQSFSLAGSLSYGYNTGRENADKDNRANIEWSEVSVEIGVSYRINNLRITPFASYTDIDGDISDLAGSAAFELEDPSSHGVRFDIFVESTAFIGIRLQTGSQSGGYISFVRRY
jgi:hypothetical protein